MIVYIKRHLYQYTLVLLLTTINCFVITPATSTVQAQTTTVLSAADWKAVEGYYQNSRNKDMYVQFTAKGDHLRARLLWNNNELKLFPATALDFATKEDVDGGPLQISFKKDGEGKVTQLLLNKDVVWTKADDYKPVEKKEMNHTAAQLHPYEGLYQLQNSNDRFIQLTEKDNKLVLKQHWDGSEVNLIPETSTDFFCREVPLFTLAFVKDSAGNFSQAVVRKRDKWYKVKTILPTTAELKAIEGKYQFKDDPDNYVQLIAKGSNIIVKQLWDKKEMILEPITSTYFNNAKEFYPMQVTKDATGAVTQIQLLGIDVFIKVKE